MFSLKERLHILPVSIVYSLSWMVSIYLIYSVLRRTTCVMSQDEYTWCCYSEPVVSSKFDYSDTNTCLWSSDFHWSLFTPCHHLFFYIPYWRGLLSIATFLMTKIDLNDLKDCQHTQFSSVVMLLTFEIFFTRNLFLYNNDSFAT